MISLIYNYIKNQSIQFKILLGVFIISFLVGLGLFINLAIVKYKYYKQLENNHEKLISDYDTLREEREVKVETLYVFTKATKEKSDNYDKEYDDAVKKIYNTKYTDDELIQFFAEYERRADSIKRGSGSN